jgi:hypothetical protein
MRRRFGDLSWRERTTSLLRVLANACPEHGNATVVEPFGASGQPFVRSGGEFGKGRFGARSCPPQPAIEAVASGTGRRMTRTAIDEAAIDSATAARRAA